MLHLVFGHTMAEQSRERGRGHPAPQEPDDFEQALELLLDGLRCRSVI